MKYQILFPDRHPVGKEFRLVKEASS